MRFRPLVASFRVPLMGGLLVSSRIGHAFRSAAGRTLIAERGWPMWDAPLAAAAIFERVAGLGPAGARAAPGPAGGLPLAFAVSS